MKNRSALLLSLLLCVALLAFAASPFDGSWSAASQAQGAPLNLTLASNGTVLTGTADGVAISNGKLSATNLWFTAVRGGVTYNYKGAVSGGTLKLSESRADGSGAARTLLFNHN